MKITKDMLKQLIKEELLQDVEKEKCELVMPYVSWQYKEKHKLLKKIHQATRAMARVTAVMARGGRVCPDTYERLHQAEKALVAATSAWERFPQDEEWVPNE